MWIAAIAPVSTLAAVAQVPLVLVRMKEIVVDEC
jgi:hypothetical protein